MYWNKETVYGQIMRSHVTGCILAGYSRLLACRSYSSAAGSKNLIAGLARRTGPAGKDNWLAQKK